MRKISKAKKRRRLLFLLFMLGLFIMAGYLGWNTVFPERAPTPAPLPALVKPDNPTEVNSKLSAQLEKKYGFKQVSGRDYVPLDAWVADQKGAFNSEYSEPEGTLTIIGKQHRYSLMLNRTNVQRDELFLPLDGKPVLDEKSKQLLIPVTLVDQLVQDKERSDTDQVSLDPAIATAPQLMDYLSFLSSPIPGAVLSTRDNHLPGAPRTYRNGVHEGIDFYSDYTGITIDRKTKVLAAADGVVVRVDHGYQEMTADERNQLLAIAASARTTPAYILDHMRGRSIWVQHVNGVMIRYCHMGTLNGKLRIGSQVSTGDWLGNVGNSGTDQGVLGTDGDLHLHMDLLIGGELFWRNLGSEDIRKVLSEIF